MINSVTIVGRVTKDLELKKTQSNKSYLQFTLACDDPYNKEHTDFVPCVAWNQSADFLYQYAHKGDVVGCMGKINTRSYDGQYGKVYVTEVVCNMVAICGQKRSESKPAAKPQEIPEEEYVEDYENTPSLDISGEDLPFY